MPFRNYSLTKGGNLTIGSIQSPDYVAGVSGWQVRKNGSAEFNNMTVRGTFNGTDYIIEADGAFFYDPVTLQIVASVAPAAGTNSLGDPFLAGVTAYFVTPGFVRYALNMNASGGFTALTWLVDSGSGWTNLAQVNATPSGLTVDSSPSGTLTLNAGANQIIAESPVSATGGSAASPTLITTDNWHSITLDAGWTAGAQVPQYRLLPDGNVQVRGQATHAGATGAVNINNSNPIPSEYWPAVNRVYRPPTAGDSAGTVQISSAGVFAMRASGFTATQVFMDGIYSI